MKYPPPTKAEILLTRGCNLSCKYCSMKQYTTVQTKSHEKELTDEQWSQVPERLAKLGVPFAPIYGAEPITRMTALTSFVSECKKYNIANTVITNATLLTDDIVERLLKAGLDSISLSHDIYPCDNTLTAKTQAAERWIDKLIPLFKDVTVIVTLNRKNISSLPAFVSRMNNKGVWVCMDIYHPYRGQEGSKCHGIDRQLLIRKDDEAHFRAVMMQIRFMKENGALIHPTLRYFDECNTNFERYILNYGWKCRSGAWITVDADGSVFGCDDFQPKSFRNKFNILDFEHTWKWSQFINKWRSKLLRCPGCFWSTHYMSDEWWGRNDFMANQTHNRRK